MNKILEAREQRSQHIQSLMSEYEYKTIAILKLNAVGENKNPLNMRFMCYYFNNLMKIEFHEKIIKSQMVQSDDGNYIYYIINEDGNMVKERTMVIEDEHYLGRLIDIDVYNKKSITRGDLSCEMRKCLMCDDYAHICARSKKHSEQELHSVIFSLIEKHLTDIVLSEVMTQIYDELEMYPKFGLVSKIDNGCHEDMDYNLFVKSSFAIKPYLREFILYGIRGTDNPDELNRIGRQAEEAMFKMTKGINTQKGLIFALGLFLPSLVKTIINNRDEEYLIEEIKRLSKSIIKDHFETLDSKDELSNGDKVFLTHGVKGIRGEALNGFQIIFDLKSHDDLIEQIRPYEYMIEIMSVLDDTTIIHRKGLEELRKIQREMKEIIDLGGCDKNLRKVASISDQYKLDAISPGGSSDMLVTRLIYDNLKYLIFLRK